MTRLLLGLLLLCAAVPFSVLISVSAGDLEVRAQDVVIRNIRVEGNRRVEPETIRSYLQFGPGDRYDANMVDESLKSLFSTGLFSDVRIRRRGNTVIVAVVENPIINRVVFEGNKTAKDETLKGEVQLKPRSVFTRARVQSDVQRILDVYRTQGRFAARVDPKIIKLPHNRVDLVYEIQEGPKTTVRSISFVGNEAFSDAQLREIITTTKTGLLSFLKPTNTYDPDRLNLDQELLRQHYLISGYADVRIVSAVADLDRDGRGFFITFTIEEGERYRFGTIDIETTLPDIDPEALRGRITTRPGKVYNAKRIDDSAEAMTLEAAALGFAFARVRPRVDRDPIARTVSITYIVEQGPRVYIERIEIVGNTRTLDRVIRREFRLAEGDAYNRLLTENARKRLRGLGFFKSVKITTEPGSAPDRVILVVTVVEQPTGELSFGAGYSSAQGVIGDIALAERNLMGKGQYVRLKLSGSTEQFQVDFSFTEPRFLGRNMAAGIDVFHRETNLRDEASFRSRSTGGGLRLGIPLSSNWSVSTRYTFVRQEIFDVKGDASQAIKDASGESYSSGIGYSLSYDTRNSRKNPTQGIYFVLSQDMTGLGGNVKYIRSIGDLRGYRPITKRFTLVGRLQGGYIESWEDDEVRLVDTFFKGGETVRGFDRAGMGPRDGITGDALGGKLFAAGTTELRFPLPWIPESFGMSGAIFADAGIVTETGDLGNIDPTFVVDDKVIRSSVGISVLWYSPVGPLRADLAHVINKASIDKEKAFRFGAATQF